MPDENDSEVPFPDDPGDQVRRIVEQQYAQHINDVLGEVPRPINWRTLPPDDLEHELLELNAWVDWLRHEYGLPAQIIPPMWHRHPELLWELSALQQHWLFCYDPQAKGNQALAWHHDFAITRERLRDWVTISGTRLDRDRPTRITPWPGGEAGNWAEQSTAETPVTERTNDFLAFVEEQGQSPATGTGRNNPGDREHRVERSTMNDTSPGPALVSPLLDSREVATYLKVSESTLSRWRTDRKGPPFLRLGGGVIRYRLDAVDAWLSALLADEQH